VVSPALTFTVAALEHSGITSLNVHSGWFKAQRYHMLYHLEDLYFPITAYVSQKKEDNFSIYY